MLTIIRQEGTPDCSEITPYPHKINNLLADSINKLRTNLNGLTVPIPDVAPGSSRETAVQREERLKAIEDMRAWSKEQFGIAMDTFCDDSARVISQLPAPLRRPATQHFTVVIKVATAFFISLFSPLILALNKGRQWCKKKLENIARYSRTAVEEILRVFLQLTGKKTYAPVSGNSYLFLPSHPFIHFQETWKHASNTTAPATLDS